MLDDGEMLEVFKKTKELGALAQVHAENGHVIDQVCYIHTSYLYYLYQRTCIIDFYVLHNLSVWTRKRSARHISLHLLPIVYNSFTDNSNSSTIDCSQ